MSSGFTDRNGLPVDTSARGDIPVHEVALVPNLLDLATSEELLEHLVRLRANTAAERRRICRLLALAWVGWMMVLIAVAFGFFFAAHTVLALVLPGIGVLAAGYASVLAIDLPTEADRKYRGALHRIMFILNQRQIDVRRLH